MVDLDYYDYYYDKRTFRKDDEIIMADVRPIDANAIEYPHVVCGIGGMGMCLYTSKRHIENMPTLDYAPVVHSHWEFIVSPCYKIWRCSNCLEWHNKESNNAEEKPNEPYCMHCGARMCEQEKDQ